MLLHFSRCLYCFSQSLAVIFSHKYWLVLSGLSRDWEVKVAIEWKEYQHQPYLLVDYSNQNSEQAMLELLEEEARLAQKSQCPILVMCDYSQAYVSSGYMDRVKALGKDVALTKVKKSALIGLNGLKKILILRYLAFTGDKGARAFDTEAEAFTWLFE
jgi:hypothetical protein